jgi:hypothetical protein
MSGTGERPGLKFPGATGSGRFAAGAAGSRQTSGASALSSQRGAATKAPKPIPPRLRPEAVASGVDHL